jgi:alpha-amylase/alpha-mannosidase (GH57 family)
VPADQGVIPLILDGENAWETFADGGEAFLRALYGGIAADSERLHSTTIEEYFRHHPPRKQITTLHTGSWIGSNFDIWIGEEEENRAWDLLGETRRFIQAQIESGKLSAEQQCAAMREIYAAEGSDWFWWYGPDFSTENDALFDDLFRQHLKNVYSICGQVAPHALELPITTARVVDLHQPPAHYISPTIDGRQSSFFEWVGAGSYEAGREQGAMYRSERFVRRILFGNDGESLSLQIEFVKWEPVEVQVRFLQPAGVIVETGVLARGAGGRLTVHRQSAGARSYGSVGAGEIIELCLPLAALSLAPGDPVSFQLRVLRDGIEREIHPEGSSIQFTLLDDQSALEHWIV